MSSTAILYKSYTVPWPNPPIAFARTIFSRPDYARYVTHFGAGSATYSNVTRLIVSDRQMCKRAIESVGGNYRETRKWVRRVQAGKPDFLTALLILNLPNLENLRVVISPIDMCCRKLTESVSERSDLFARIIYLSLIFEEDLSRSTQDAIPICFFAQVSNLRSLDLRLHDSIDHELFDPGSWSIEKLHFSANIEPEKLVSVLRWFRGVKRLCFSISDYRYDSRVPFELFPGATGRGLGHLKVCAANNDLSSLSFDYLLL